MARLTSLTASPSSLRLSSVRSSWAWRRRHGRRWRGRPRRPAGDDSNATTTQTSGLDRRLADRVWSSAQWPPACRGGCASTRRWVVAAYGPGWRRWRSRTAPVRRRGHRPRCAWSVLRDPVVWLVGVGDHAARPPGRAAARVHDRPLEGPGAWTEAGATAIATFSGGRSSLPTLRRRRGTVRRRGAAGPGDDGRGAAPGAVTGRSPRC